MYDVIYKVTAKQVKRMEREYDFLDLKTHILDLSNYYRVPIWDFNDLIETPDGICIYTYDEEIANRYKNGLDLLSRKRGV